MLYFVARQVLRQVGRDSMHVHKANIHEPTATDGLPSLREPRSRNVLPEQDMQMRVAVFLELQHADKRERFSLTPPPREIDTHQAPQFADVAIRALAIRSGKFFRSSVNVAIRCNLCSCAISEMRLRTFLSFGFRQRLQR